MVFQRPPESYTRVTDLSSLPILHSSSIRQGNQATQQHASTVSMRIDVNAPVHMHMSHSFHLVGLNCNDNPERDGHKCFIIKTKGEEKTIKQNIAVKDQ